MRLNRVCLALAVTVLTTSAAAQRRPAGALPQEQKVAVAIDLRVNGAPYAFNGPAVCEHLAKGSIYDTLAERWSVRQDDNGRNMALTLWRPLKGSGDMVTFFVAAGGKRHEVNTVKGPQTVKTTGTGTAKFAAEGAGGTFTIDATADSGAKISGTVKCEKFTVPDVVAGN